MRDRYHVAVYQTPGGRKTWELVFDDLPAAWAYADEMRAIVAMSPHPDHVGVTDLDSGEWVTHDDYLDLVCEPGEQQGAGVDDPA